MAIRSRCRPQARCYGVGREANQPLLIGSAKTNIGHLEAAAGIAGVIKVILSLEHEVLPKHLNFQNPSPHIPWDRLAVQVVAEATAWERNGRPRIAGVSSFGFSGTNAHVILEEAPVAQPAEAPDPVDQPDDRRFSVLPLSARTPGRAGAARRAIPQLVERAPGGHPGGRVPHRRGGASTLRAPGRVGGQFEGIRHRVTRCARRRPPGTWSGARRIRSTAPKTAWLFPGQGSQYAGMARELFETEPVFAETLTRCAAAVADVLEKPLLDVIFDVDGPDGEETLRQTSYAQPALFAVEMGLARLWQSWGFEPDVVLGHSVGQYSAACVAGVFSLEDGALLMAERGRLFGSLPAGGRMVAVFAAAERVESCTDEFPSLSVAAYNGANTVLSGPAEDLEKAVAGLTADGVRCDWLDTSHAFHSALLDPILDEFESYAERFDFKRATTDFDRQPHRRRARQERQTRWRLLAPPRASTGRIRQERAHPRRSELQGAAGGRPATGAHRRGPAGVARPGHRTAGDRVDAPKRRRPPPDHRSRCRRLRPWPPARLRRSPAAGRAQARPAHLSVPASPVLVPDDAARRPKLHRATRTEAVRLLEDGRIDELAALLDGAAAISRPPMC